MKDELTFLSMVFGLVGFGLILTAESDAKIESVGAWLLDEAEGNTVEDVSGKGINGEIQGGYKYVQGQFGDALEFNGQDTLVLFENDDPNQAFILHRDYDVSFIFWLQPLDDNHRSVFWTRGNAADSDRFNFYSGPGETLGFDYREVDGAVIHLISQEIALPLKEWSHLAVVREGDNYKIFRNGKEVAHKTDSNPKLPEATSWMMSGRPNFTFFGLMDEVAFFDFALSEADISNVMNNGLAEFSVEVAVQPSDKIAAAWARLKTSR